jgi:hypothetical protein
MIDVVLDKSAHAGTNIINIIFTYGFIGLSDMHNCNKKIIWEKKD